MDAAVIALTVVGFILMFVGVVMMLVAAFRVSIAWGVCSLLLPIASLAFLIVHWAEARAAFLVQMLGCILCVLGVVLPLTLGAGNADGAATFRSLAPVSFSNRPAAGMLRSVVSDPSDAQAQAQVQTGNESLIGRRLVEVRETLGAPTGELRTSAGVTLFYPDMEITSKDGETVSDQQARAEGTR